MFIHPGSFLNTYKYSKHYADAANRKINKTSVLSSRVHIWREGAAEAFGRSVIAPHRLGRQESDHKKQTEVIREGGGLNKGEQPSWGKTMAEVWRVIQQVQRTEAGEAQAHGVFYTKKSSNGTVMWSNLVLKESIQAVILVCSGYHDRVVACHSLGGLNNRNYFLAVLQAGTWDQGCGRFGFSWGFSLCYADGYLLAVSFLGILSVVCTSLVSFSLIMRTLGILDEDLSRYYLV